MRYPLANKERYLIASIFLKFDTKSDIDIFSRTKIDGKNVLFWQYQFECYALWLKKYPIRIPKIMNVILN